MTRRQILARITFWIMVATLGSRVLGFLREVQLAYYFGLSDMRGAFTVAFRIPNLIRTLVADAAISAAFIPVFTELLVKQSKDTWKVASQMINVTFLALSGIVILCEIFMPQIIAFTTPGYVSNVELFQHTIHLSRIIFPIIVILGVGGIVVGVLHSLNYFTAPALAPIFWNIVNIVAVFLFAKTLGIDSAAWGLLVATFVMLITQAWPLIISPFLKPGAVLTQFRYSLHLGLKDPTMQQIGFLMIPVTLSIGIININALVDNYFASLLGPDKVAAIDSAFRLFQLPQGLFAIAIGTVLFPTLSKYVVQKDMKTYARTLGFGIREIFFITLPFVGWFMVLALPISRFCFERGAFTAQDSWLVAQALIYFSIGMCFTSANTLLNRGFYSLKKTWIPLYVGIFLIFLNAFLDWWLIQHFGYKGICLSTSLVSIFNFIALLILIKREVPDLHVSKILMTIFKIPLVTLLLAGISYFTWTTLDVAFGRSLLGQFGSIVLACSVGGIVYVGISLALRFDEVHRTMQLLIRKKG